ncbi:MAG: chitinase [Solirubrobacteraceae bacterium]
MLSTLHPDAIAPEPSFPDPPQPKLSLVRLVALLAGLALAGAAAFYGITHARANAAGSKVAPAAFAPYVDVTLTPTYAFEDPAANPDRGVYLGFLVAKPAAPCTPSWGGYYTLAAAQQALNLDERIAQVRSQGGTPTLSFGGQANSELAVSCHSTAALTSAYLAPVRRYHVHAIDLDVEGPSLQDAAANARRATALAAAQQAESARGEKLSVWLTLPVATGGVTKDGLAAIRAMLAAHVHLTGVNVMAMNFGGPERHMVTPVEHALNSTHEQLRSIGLAGGSQAAWSRLGVTVMIGVNDVPGEVFTVADARKLTAFAASRHITRVSMWSINRDSQCGSVFAQTGVLSNTCSGVIQRPLQFTRIFSRLGGTGSPAAATAAGAVPAVQAAPTDNPSSSPYPIWRPQAMYDASFKVVWHRIIYQAKWFSEGAAPDAPAPSGGQSPWLMIGPVLAGAASAKTVPLDRSPHPNWSATAVYHRGARVRYHGLPFVAKWYTKGDTPERALPADTSSPWQPLFTIAGEPTTAAAG